MKVQDIAALIEVRNFAYSSVDNLSIKLSKEEVKLLQAKIPQLDKYILGNIVELALPLVEDGSKKKNEAAK